MEKRNNRFLIIIISLIVLVSLIGVLTVRNSQSQASQETTANITDMTALKSSEYTNANFDEVNLGDSKSDVEAKMGQLVEVDVETEEDVYSTEDEGSIYYFYFMNDKLENVSVFLAE